MTSTAAENRDKLYGIRKQMLSGQITYDEAKEQAAPIIEAINTKAKEIAKRHGKRPQLVSFGAIMR